MALSWDLQQTYLDGLSEDEEIPFRMAERSVPPPVATRHADTGSKVIDLAAMREELEALRRQQTAAG